MATLPPAPDRPVETGHELVLATLLVHFGVDEIEQLPEDLQAVVKDVYDIATNLADAKVACQWELARLQIELDRVRSELITERFARLRLEAASTPRPPQQQRQRLSNVLSGGSTPTCVSNYESHRHACGKETPPADALSPSQRNQLARIDPALREGDPTSCRHGSASSPPKMTSHARHCTATTLLVISSECSSREPEQSQRIQYRQMSPVPLYGGESMARSAEPVMESIQTTHTAKWDECEQPPTGAKEKNTGVRVVVGTRAGKRVDSRARLPATVSGRRREDEQRLRAVYECLRVQIAGERRLHALQRTVGQISKWEIKCRDTKLFVVVGKLSAGKTNQIKQYTSEDVRLALAALCDDIEDLNQECAEALEQVEDTSVDKPWLLGRHQKMSELMTQLDSWIDDVAVGIHRFSRSKAFIASYGATRVHTRSSSMWSENDEGQDNFLYSPTNEEVLNVLINQTKPKSSSELTEVFNQYAVCSFLTQALGVYAEHCIHGADSDTLWKIGEVGRDLQVVSDKYYTSKQAFHDRSWRITQWDDAFSGRHEAALKAIQRRAIVCSEKICGIANRLRTCCHGPTQRIATSPDRFFPAARYSWAWYEEVVVAIVSSHVVLTRFHEVPLQACDVARQTLLHRIQTLMNAMFAWTDPRFAGEANRRPFEKREYLILLDWCDALHKIVASDASTTTAWYPI